MKASQQFSGGSCQSCCSRPAPLGLGAGIGLRLHPVLRPCSALRPAAAAAGTATSSRRGALAIAAAAAQQAPAVAPVQQLQQQPVVAATQQATTLSAAAQRVLPFAALSRVLLTANNSSMFRSALSQRRQPVSGPLGLLLFLVTLLAASAAAIRSALLRRGKACRSCRGFGLQRCRLCLGSGRVDWAAKLKHFDVCPLCMNKRFIVCAECGGHYHRAMFSHRRRQAGGALEPEAGSPAGGNNGSGEFEGPIVLNLAGAGGASVVVPTGNGRPGGMRQVLSSMSD